MQPTAPTCDTTSLTKKMRHGVSNWHPFMDTRWRKTPRRKDNPLGLEFDLELFIEEYGVMKWSFAYAVLFQWLTYFVDARDNSRREAGIAQTMQLMLSTEF